ncbi:hypothetical protein ASPCAL09590 [Aspergillus calidoustus]|uniref:Uncharacterized protein n=1 Tax=Aspergillus calidoustus TaxID=454130 RepID=A0A0U5GY09_ASPCI|nr:hypothetical protein ASPCAL09590 [Aspergillus calidoustus]
MATQPPSRLMALLHIRTIASSILHFLPRSSLKNLRLASKALDELVLLESYLFSRVYLSSTYCDIHKLQQTANHPRIARCVTTLVWDVCTGPYLSMAIHLSSQRAPELVREAMEFRGAEYTKISDAGLDFRVLMAVIPRLPRLRAVVFTNLMGRWARLRHSPDSAAASDTCLAPSRMHLPFYESPAMRAWNALRAHRLQDFYNQWPAGRDVPEPSLELAPRLGTIADGIQRGQAETEDNHPGNFLSRLGNKFHQGPLLCLLAFEAHGRKLQSLCVEALPERARNSVSAFEFRGFDLRPFVNSDPGLAGLSTMVRPLRKLALCLDNSTECRTSWDWRRAISSLLREAEYLHRLELRLFRRDTLGEDLVLPTTSNLEVLVLESFVVASTELEGSLLPWAVRVGLRTLQLIECPFVIPDGMHEMDLIRSLADRDISMDKQDSFPPSYHDPQGAARDLLCAADAESTVSDTSSIDDPWLAACEHPKLPREDPDASRIRFMDLDFESHAASNPGDSDASDTDSTYFPYTDELWSRQMDAPFLNVDLDEPGWKEEMANLYYEMYHEDIIRRYDGDYDEDTPDLEEEYPMRPLRAAMARVLPSAGGESFLFLLDGGRGLDLSEERRGLWLRIDCFSVQDGS